MQLSSSLCGFCLKVSNATSHFHTRHFCKFLSAFYICLHRVIQIPVLYRIISPNVNLMSTLKNIHVAWKLITATMFRLWVFQILGLHRQVIVVYPCFSKWNDRRTCSYVKIREGSCDWMLVWSCKGTWTDDYGSSWRCTSSWCFRTGIY